MAEAVAGGGSAAALAGLSRLAPWRQVAVLVGLAASVALGVAAALWAQKPDYTLLYAATGAKDTAAMSSTLAAAGIPTRIDPSSGAILVPAGKLYTARMRLAAAGLPRGSQGAFEVFEKSQGFGVSQFVERARYQHALEEELSNTIAQLDNVQSARVHLAIPRASSFIGNRNRPSASVFVQIYPGRQLADGQANAIANLVAAAVPDLHADRVKVVDQLGQLLNAGQQPGGAGLDDQQLKYERQMDRDYIARIVDILSPLVGSGKVRAEVTASIDFSRLEQARERYNPDQPALRSERISEQGGSPTRAGGIPGALSNEPPAATSVPQQVTPAANATPGPAGQTKKKAARGPYSSTVTRNFELDRTISQMTKPPASLRRLSVAVVVDDARVPGPGGHMVSRPRSPEQLARFTELVKEAVGYDAERGDSVKVINAPFALVPEPPPAPPTPWWKRAWVWTAARDATGALVVLFLIFGVLRPVMRNLVTRGRAEPGSRALTVEAADRPGLPAGTRPEMSEDRLSLSSEGAAARLTHGGAPQPDAAEVDRVRELVVRDPKRVASVMKTWVQDDG